MEGWRAACVATADFSNLFNAPMGVSKESPWVANKTFFSHPFRQQQRLGGFRELTRSDIRLGGRANDSSIYLKPQKNWPGDGWETMTEEVFKLFVRLQDGFSIQKEEHTPTHGACIRKYTCKLPPATNADEYIFKPDKSGRKNVTDAQVPNKPMTKQNMGKLIARCREVLRKETGTNLQNNSRL